MIRKLCSCILTVLGTLLFLTALGRPVSETEAKDSLAYEIRTWRAFSRLFVPSENGQDTTIVTLSYPEFAPEINALVRETVFPGGEDSPAQVSDGFLVGYDDHAEFELQKPENEDRFLQAWYLDLFCTVRLNTGRWLTLENTIDSYSGGAHGMRVSVWDSYDIAAKKKLTVDDLVWEPEILRRTAEKIFRKQEGLSATASLETDYFFENGEFSLPDNFGLTEKGLLFYYNIYEIKPYVDGPTDILVPYSAIRDILTETGTEVVKSLSNPNKSL